ncbi:NeuD/PglB/VioB family sugar acetyltransferase [Phenylobacterium sp.]|jgi:sugar O-acyltransferase (sialic acid O-acetyltransferase NeuD family)|uniref:NeuD/PglB/VioB family sugar acetyltransferase n=1 Tax=Phenylobacterium sp. TaxID=1871053 RepID=UPI002F40584A
MTDYVLVGGGAFAREILGWFTPDLPAGDRFAGYIDDGVGPLQAAGYDLPQLGGVADFRPNPSQRLVMALTDPAGKAAVAGTLLAAGGEFATLIHPRAWVTSTARIGKGVVIALFADISADAKVGDFATVNGYSSVGHDAELGAYSTLSGYVDLTGYVKVGPKCFFGTGARVLPKVSVGEGSTIGAGAVVVRTVAAGSTVYAAPARKL